MPSKLARSYVSLASALLAVACGDASDPARSLSALGPGGEAEIAPTATQPPVVTGADPEAAASARNLAPDTRHVEALGQGSRAFAFALFHQVARATPDQNVVLSPYSVSSSLGMLFAGARRKTEAEMGATLRLPVGQPAIHDAFNAAALQLASRGKDQLGADRTPFRLNVDNALWVQDGVSIEPSFVDTLASSYGAAPQAVDFAGDPEGARRTLNARVAERTEQRVPELLGQGDIEPSTSLVLTNTVYFNASWKVPFDPRNTAPATFTKRDGSTASVPMMNASQRLPYARGEGFQAIALPYASEALSLIAVLPDAGTYDEIEAAADGDWFDALRAELAPRQVAVAFPKLNYRAHASLKQPLISLDMGSAFSGADFTGITPEGAVVDDVIHEAVIEVFEGGTIAAAATAVVLGRSAAPRDEHQVRFDRPFFYAIIDAPTGQILFLGRVLHPQG